MNRNTRNDRLYEDSIGFRKLVALVRPHSQTEEAGRARRPLTCLRLLKVNSFSIILSRPIIHWLGLGKKASWKSSLLPSES